MLTVVGGPMFSGKTTWLIEHTKKLVPGSFVIYKPNIDTRYATGAVVTHNGQSLGATNIDHKNPLIPPLSRHIKTLLIDELNFFSISPLMEQIQKQMKLGRDVVGVGLLFDSKKKPFGATLPLSDKADTFIKLTAICDGCGGAAIHSYRKNQKKDKIVLGAGETYGACCEPCWQTFQPK